MTVELVPAPQSRPDISRGKRPARPRGVPELHRVTAAEMARVLIPNLSPLSEVGHPVMLVRFLWVTGCRISEALAVTPSEINFGAPSVRLVTLKRRALHYRALPLPLALCGELAQWIAYWRPAPDDRIFPWGRSQAYEIVHQLLMVGGVDRERAHPHAIRHGHAFHALAHGVPVNALQAALGHTFLSTTAIYTRATGADLRAAYDRVTW